MRIYTRGGDGGETGLLGGGRVSKDDARVEAYGSVDELNAALGSARAHGLGPELDALAAQLQEELFLLGADLATPEDPAAGEKRTARLGKGAVAVLETRIDECEQDLPRLTSFLLPGGTPAGAALHLARTVCRRAERRAVALARTAPIPPAAIPYLNRLSDLLFVMARCANARAGRAEERWET